LRDREKAHPVALSGGEQQRVCIARAVVNRPSLLLADEPAASLDADAAQDILALFRSFHQVGVTVMLATHDERLIERFPARRITLAHGHVTSPAEALLTNLASLARRAGAAPVLTVYLAATAGTKERDALLAAIQRREGVASARLITREQALAELQAREGVRDLLAGLPGNPLPDSVAVTPADRQPGSIESLRADLARLPGSAEVELDSAWVERVGAIVRAGELLTGVLAAMLAAPSSP
jgi:energy-coupling factor transporter ATP-binding protein EcfA2